MSADSKNDSHVIKVKNNTFISDQGKLRHDLMKSKVLVLVLLFILLSIPAVHAEDALDWYTKGQYAVLVGNYADALTYFNNALALDRNYAPALSGKAVALNSLGNYDEAITSADAAIAIKPTDKNALNARAYGLLKLGRYAEAVNAYDMYFAAGYTSIDAYCNEGHAFLMLNKSDDAVKSFEKCTAIDPKNSDGWNGKGLALTNLGKYQEALNAYDEATRITVMNAEVWNNKGLAYAALGKYQDALQSFNKALGIKPDFADALQNKENMMGRLQLADSSGTITPSVTVSPVGTLFTTVTPSQLPTQVIPQITVTEEPQKTTVPVAKKTTYSPVSPLSALTAVGLVYGLMIAANRIRK